MAARRRRSRTLGAEPSLASSALRAGASILLDDLEPEPRVPAVDHLHEHGIVCGAAVVVHGSERPYGVLEAFATEPRAFTADDVRFLESVATVVGLSIERRRAEAALLAAEASTGASSRTDPRSCTSPTPTRSRRT
jgi:GAF domain-containing protein